MEDPGTSEALKYPGRFLWNSLSACHDPVVVPSKQGFSIFHRSLPGTPGYWRGQWLTPPVSVTVAAALDQQRLPTGAAHRQAEARWRISAPLYLAS